MGIKGGPDIVTDGLVFNLDAAGAVSDKGYPINGLPVEYLIVAGGGGGGGSPHGAGGGAGGLLHGYTKASLSTGSYTITVGGGGAGKVGKKIAPWPSAGTNYGANGGNSTAFGKTALGGGGGGGYSYGGSNDTIGKNGGSGGGTGRDPSGVGQATQPSSSDGGFGNKGGRGGYSFSQTSGRNNSGGGGGAGERGNLKDSYIETDMSKGGAGKYYGYTFGRSVGDNGWFAGGGGGSFWLPASSLDIEKTAGIGGGGRGAHGNITGFANPTDGTVNTGGGGGGSERHVSGDGIGGDGGSGIVIIKYKGPQKATGGDSIITRKGYTIHVFTSSGTFTVGDRVGGLSTSKIVGVLENMGSGPNDYKTANKGYFSFDGSNQAIKIPNFDVSTLGGNFTITSIMMPVSPISLIFSSLDVSLSSSTKNLNFYFSDTASYGMSANTIRLQFGRSTWAWQVYASNGLSLSKNNWYFVAVTAANLNTSTHTIKFYVNDQVINGTKWTASTAAPINYGGDISNSTFLARNYTASAPTYANTYHTINIANLQIYNKTLSDDEILDNYNATKGRFGL